VSGAPDANTQKAQDAYPGRGEAKGPTIEIVLMYFEPKSSVRRGSKKTVSVPAVKKCRTNVVILRAWMKTLRSQHWFPRPARPIVETNGDGCAGYKQTRYVLRLLLRRIDQRRWRRKSDGEKGVNAR